MAHPNEQPTIRPLADRLLVKLVEAGEVRKGGIIIPDSAKEKPQEATVIAVGPGKLGDDGRRQAPDVKAGDKVLVSKYGGTEVKIDGADYQILRGDDVLAILS